MKRLSGFPVLGLIALGLMIIPQTSKAAGAPAPIGLWRGQTSGDYINVQANGSCSASGSINVSGTCTWMSTATGGVLTMTYPWTIAPGHIGWSIRWVNQTTILVNSVELFVRQG